MENTESNTITEISKYKPGQWVKIFKIKNEGNRRTKMNWFSGLVHSVASRGLMVIPFDEKPMGENTDPNCAQFVPFSHIKEDIEIEISSRRE